MNRQFSQYIFSLLLLCLCHLSGLSQVNVLGSSCVPVGVSTPYSIFAYASGSITYNYNITGGTLSTGGHTGSTTTTNAAFTINVIWTTNGTISVTCSAGYNVFFVTIQSVFKGGAISSGKTQNINYNTTPVTINCAVATGGNACYTPAYAYQWEQSPDNIHFGPLNGATSQNLSFSSAQTATSYYRRRTTETNTDSITYSDTATVHLNPPNPILPIVPGSLTPSVQYINYSHLPVLVSSPNAAGGNYTYSYQWQMSTDSAYWADIIEAAYMAYSPPALTSSTWYRVAVTSNGTTVYSAPAKVNVYPPVIVGTVVPAMITIASGNNPGGINCSRASGGNGTYRYQWQSSSNGASFTSISGDTLLHHEPGLLTANTWYRIMVISYGDTFYTNTSQVMINGTVPDVNFIVTKDIRKPGADDSAAVASLSSPIDLTQTTQFFDGLGRPLQIVSRQTSPLGKDQVSMTEYDGFGREAIKYLPYTSSSSDGNYKPFALADQNSFYTNLYSTEQYYYAQVNYEASPLNRVTSSMSPGFNWLGKGRSVGNQYLFNTSNDRVRIWSIASTMKSLPVSISIYGTGQLYKNVTTDEQGHRVVEYKDKAGRIVLKKVQISDAPGLAHVGWLSTYYVYDTLENLRFVMQPRAVEWLMANNWNFAASGADTVADELCFRYEYDNRNRMIIKKVPGAGEVRMVYDVRDRLVMTQDSVLRSQKKWMVYCYDALNRQDTVALMTDASHYNDHAYHITQAMQAAFYPRTASFPTEVVTQFYYDSYDWVTALGNSLSASPNTTYNNNATYFFTTYNASPNYAVAMEQYPIATGMPTGSRSKVIGTTQFLYTVPFYDDHGRVIQTESSNYTNGIDWNITQYDFFCTTKV